MWLITIYIIFGFIVIYGCTIQKSFGRIAAVAERDSLPLLTPKIGKKVDLDDAEQRFERWWEKTIKN
jgi:hypothetical protein